MPKDQLTIVGKALYRYFDRTAVLTQVMRQRGGDPAAVEFRELLNGLRVGICT